MGINPQVQRVGICAVAPLVNAHSSLLRPLLRSLLHLPTTYREQLLQPAPHAAAGDEPVDAVVCFGLTASQYPLLRLPAVWPALAVAKDMAALIAEDKLENLEREHVSVLKAVCGEMTASQEWVSWFLSVKDYLYVSLCDEELCGLAEQVLRLVFSTLGDGVSSTLPTLLSSLNLVFPEGVPLCQEKAVQFMMWMASQTAPLPALLRSLLGMVPTDWLSSHLSQVVAALDNSTTPTIVNSEA